METIDKFYQALDEYDVINPKLTFDGDYIFQPIDDMQYDKNKDILYLNSIVDEKGNRYENFMKKYYCAPFNMNNFAESIAILGFPLLVNALRKDGKGRELSYSYIPFLCNIAEYKEGIAGSLEDPIQVIDILREWYKEQRKMIGDFKRNGLNSEYCRQIAPRFDSLRRGELTDSEVMAICRNIKSTSLDKVMDRFTNIIVNLNFLKKDLEKGMQPIDNEEFKSCFERDKYYLMYMKSIMDNQESSITSIGKPDNSFIEVSQYIYTLKYFHLVNYNTVINVYDKKKGKVVRYNIDDLIAEYDAIMERFKDTLISRQVSVEQLDKLNVSHDITGCDKLRQLLSSEDADTISTNWEVLPSGTKEVVDARTSRRSPRKEPSKPQKVTEDDILYRKYVLQDTNYMLRLVGKDKFTGYVGYMYPNGLVVFEIFYQPNGSITQSGATYIMNYKNFVEFSKLTKVEIMEYIKNTENPDVKRIYHKGKWAENLRNVLNSVEETQEVTMEVGTLVGQIKTRSNSESDC